MTRKLRDAFAALDRLPTGQAMASVPILALLEVCVQQQSQIASLSERLSHVENGTQP